MTCFFLSSSNFNLVCGDENGHKIIKVDGIYNTGKFELEEKKTRREGLAFSRVVVCKQQEKMSFFQQATTYWRVKTCFKTIQ